MKKVLIATGVAVLALATVAGAQGYMFNTNLTVGSTGSDVSALQTWLIGNGFHIAPIESGAAAKGYFGSATKTAVMAYQSSAGLPNTGFVGPLTRAKLNGTPSASSMCPAGMVCTPTTPVATTCPAGFVCTPVTTPGTTPVVSGSITTPGIAGTLAVSLQSTPSNGTSLSKGQEADVAAYKVQAGASDMQMTSIQLDFNTRFWLYASSITVLDGSTVVGQKTGLSVNDFTELTVGSDYRITIPTNYVVPRATTKYLTVHVAMLPVTDRTSGTLSITNAIIRSVDGTGVTDSETVNSTRSFTFTGSNNGQVVLTLDSASPLQGLVQISTANQTDNVPLAIYDIKSQNIATTLRSLTLQIHANGTAAITSLFGDIKIKAAGLTYSADSISATSSYSALATFTNLQIPLPADQYVPVSVYGKVNQDTNGTTLTGAIASTTWSAVGTAGGSTNNPDVEDSSYTAIAVNATNLTSSDQTFSASSAVLSNLVATLGSPITKNNTVTGYNITVGFTITAGNNTLYLSADPGIALATTTIGSIPTGNSTTTALTIGNVTANPGTLAGDTNVTSSSGYYVIPAGSSRTFTYQGLIDNTGGSSGVKGIQVTAVKYGTSSSNLIANTINYNLSSLKVTGGF